MKAQVFVLPALLAALHSYAGSPTPPEVGVSPRTEGHSYARGDAPATLDSAVAWLEQRATEMIRTCRRTMTNGMAAFPPQVGGGYEAFWLRDYAYMLEGNRAAFSDPELKNACRFFLAGQRADGAMVDCIKFDGTPCYMPGYGTLGRNPVADGSQFMVDVAWHTFQQTRDTNLVAETVDALIKGMKAVPRSTATGLVHIKPGPENDRAAYGFTDAIRKQGDELFCSLLFVQASRQLAQLLESVGRPEEAGAWTAEARTLAGKIREVFWDGNIGLFRAATVVCNQPDLWGSAFAVFLDVASPEQAQAVARYFKDHYPEIVKRGQLRHLPASMEWEQTLGVKPGTYQNGAYWATPVGWFVFTLDLADPALADRTVVELVRDFIATGDENECVNDGYANVSHYVASVALPLDGIRALRARRTARTKGLEPANGPAHRAGAESAPERSPQRLSEHKALQEFLNCQLVPKLGNAWDYTFAPGQFPRVEWDRPEVVEKVMGSFPLNVRWFDADRREVTSPDRPGRYAFYAEGITPAGKVIRRSGTRFCRPKDWMGWNEKLKVHFDFLPLDGVSRKSWDRHQEAIDGFAGRTVLLSILRQQDGAVLMSYLHEMPATGEKPALTDTPLVRDHEYHLALKQKILGVENKWPSLRPPRRAEGKPAPVLRAGTETEAGFKPGTVTKLREICRAWFEQSREPFNLVVARRGVMVLDESFGDWSWGELTRETPTEMASLTKLVTGVLFAQFVDQGLIGIDDPVGRYFPDFPITGTNFLTLRHCFTHATALEGHEEWGGMHNPWLENVIANASEYLRPGQVHNYNGMGYDLAGKVMEIVSGKSIFRLMRENLFDPLEMSHTTLEEDLGFSCFSTAADFARLGQVLLNQGAYGELGFFSPKTFEQLLPQPLSRYYPGLDQEWGIGITWMRQSHPDAGKNGVPSEVTLLSRNTIGHGSATSAILRVDLDHELVISQTRRRAGRDYDQHLLKFLIALQEGLP